MITIECCYTCRWYKNDKCVNLDQWNPHADPNESCDNWQELKSPQSNFQQACKRATNAMRELQKAF